MLRSQPSSRCADERAARRNDQPQSTSHQGLVSEQKVQRQEEDHSTEDADATGKGGYHGIADLKYCFCHQTDCSLRS